MVQTLIERAYGINSDGHIQLLERTVILEDDGETLIARGEAESRSIPPGADVSGENAAIQAIAQVFHTPEAIAKYRRAIARELADRSD